jgi:hypothetical protein
MICWYEPGAAWSGDKKQRVTHCKFPPSLFFLFVDSEDDILLLALKKISQDRNY